MIGQKARRILVVVTLLGLVVLSGLLILSYQPGGDFDAAAAKKVAQSYDADIIRDDFGVPSIKGPRDADVAFGLGYAHAQDDWETIETVLLMARGALALRDGAAAAPSDYLVRLLRVDETVAAGYERDLSPAIRAVVEAYAAGINAYAADHPGRFSSYALPASGRDVVAGFVFRAPFFYGLEGIIKDAMRADAGTAGGEKISALNRSLQQVLHLTGGVHLGSNAFAVAPSRSSDGKTRLMINSHQPYTGPVAWYEARLQSGEGWASAGALFPGSPVILVGHNRDLGWAHTVNEPDLVDFYQLEVDDPEDPTAYRYDGGWRDFERGTARIPVHLWGPFAWTVKRPLLWSVHGPVLETPSGFKAMAYAGAGDVRAVEQWYRMNKAGSMDQWMDAMAMQAVPSLNTVYADRAGNIAFIYNAAIPDRKPGPDYSKILPGDDPDLLWRGRLPFAAVPKLINPDAGYLISANGTPLRATAGENDLGRNAIPPTLTVEKHLTNRALRALALFDADPAISHEDILRIKYDQSYAPTSNMVRFVKYIERLDFRDDPFMAKAQDVVLSWDNTAEPESTAAALIILSTLKAIHGFAFNGWDMDPALALRQTADELIAHHGGLQVPWGAINKIRRGSQRMTLGGGPDALRAVYGGRSLGEDGTLDAMAGDSYIQLVEWDQEGAVRSFSVHQFGSATLDQGSPHYADQLPIFVAERFRPDVFQFEPHFSDGSMN
ncbi:acyl-homoserine lactone acylase PvdQ [alpha proteobacterium Q-1]|nr:acyl-homoserine lactone acylase PvdQ [alpha proteobacterium Q-1]